jgi:exonuclease SbcD
MKDAIVRLVVDYPREWEAFVDEASVRAAAASTFEFHLVKRPQAGARARIGQDDKISEMSAYDLLDIYWRSAHVDKEGERKQLNDLAREIIELPFEEEQ